MRAPLHALALGLPLLGCITVRANYVPPGVTQEIGSKRLGSATARWECEGGEELGVLPDGNLFVASQDFVVPALKDVSGMRAFGYERSGDGWNFEGAAMFASYLLPKDPNGDAIVRYGTMYKTSHDISSSDDGFYYVFREKITYAYAPIWAELCWPRGTLDDPAARFARLYRGAERTDAAPAGRHMRIGVCGANLLPGGEYRSTSTEYATAANVTSLLGVGWAGGDDTAYFPPDVWIADDGTVTMVGVDGRAFRLTFPYEFGGTKGFLYERAQVPVYVNPARGKEGVYLFRWRPGAMGEAPRPLGDDATRSYVMGCALTEPK